MEHQKHQKRIKIISACSISLFFIELLSTAITIHQLYSFSSLLELGIISCTLSFLSILCGVDILLYNKAHNENVIWYIRLWKLTNKFKAVITFSSVAILIISGLCRSDANIYTYVWILAEIIVFSGGGLGQIILSGHLKNVNNQCVMECRTNFNCNVNSSYNIPYDNGQAAMAQIGKFHL